MATALYRRYRPETFADVIGQEHVTEPLMQALRTGRVNHAYLFSGPRGCGKTTSARILARCLNCEQGPTPEPCGLCDSCVALARGGAGTVDVVEIDAASHGGVDDARDLRERASYGPAQSRYKIYIIDEAHMVTPQGFNALLKIVEEPPEHVKFVFATTEPEKVIGTIRSRTHHYPFRLVPPAKLSDYMQSLCNQEQVPVAPGVLSFVTRAGGGSVRDSLSVLDQLIAGSSDEGLTYDGAVSLLGFTDGELLDATIDALAARDGAATFRQVDKVIESGHDPRRFIEDLLERLRDLIIVAAVPEGAAQVLRGTPEDQLERMRGQQAAFGQGTLSRAADIVNAGLTELTGANSPRLQLELICARILLPATSGEQGYAARLDRLERRLDVAGVPSSAGGSSRPPQHTSGTPPVGMPQSSPPAGSGPGALPAASPGSAPSRTVTDFTPPHANVSAPAARGSSSGPGPTGSAPSSSAAGGMGGGGTSATVDRLTGSAAASEPPASETPATSPSTDAHSAADQGERPASQHDAAQIDQARHEVGAAPVVTPSESVGGPSVAAQGPETTDGSETASGGMNTDAIRRAWPDVLGRISGMRRVTWTFMSQHAQVMAYDGRTLTLGIGTVGLTNTFRSGNHAEIVRQALIDELGVDAIVNAVPLPEASESAPPAAAPAPGVGRSGEPNEPSEPSDAGSWSRGGPDAASASPSPTAPPARPQTGSSSPRSSSSVASGRSLEHNAGWGTVTSPAPDWANASPTAHPATSANPSSTSSPDRGAPANREPSAAAQSADGDSGTVDVAPSPSNAGAAGAPAPDGRPAGPVGPVAPRSGASAVRESLAGARSGARRGDPHEPRSDSPAPEGDDSAVSDDDDDVEVSGDVGRSVVERVLGGRVLSESDES